MPGFIVDADRSNHPPLEVRGPWAIQVPLVIALERESCEDPDDALPAIAKAARAAEAAVRSRELDFAVEHVKMMVRANIAGMEPLTPAVQRQVDLFEYGVGLLRCEHCKHVPGATKCRHDLLLDPLVVADHGNEVSCLHFLTRTFAELVDLADEYQRLVFGNNDAPKLRLRLVIGHGTGVPIEASTHFPKGDVAGDRATEVRIVLPATLTEEEVGKLPYFLFHEIFVHAAEEWDKAGRRNGTPSICPLREGFVDAAAAHLLVERLLTGALRLNAYAGAQDWLVTHVEDAHLQRAMPGRNIGQGKVLALSRKIGRNVFQTFSAQQRADVAIRVAAAVTRLELDDASRGKWTDALGIAATHIGSKVGDVRDCGYVFAVRLHQLTTQPRIVISEVARVFEEFFIARDKKQYGDF